mmetsp:Transcript_46014/g.107461  ORF Transcript_46014/g.107461 Transcript_46014/m.107461 type:complete len:252 (-) Transcript_46014:1164-1919(-)
MFDVALAGVAGGRFWFPAGVIGAFEPGPGVPGAGCPAAPGFGVAGTVACTRGEVGAFSKPAGVPGHFVEMRRAGVHGTGVAVSGCRFRPVMGIDVEVGASTLAAVTCSSKSFFSPRRRFSSGSATSSISRATVAFRDWNCAVLGTMSRSAFFVTRSVSTWRSCQFGTELLSALPNKSCCSAFTSSFVATTLAFALPCSAWFRTTMDALLGISCFNSSKLCMVGTSQTFAFFLVTSLSSSNSSLRGTSFISR